MKKVEKGLLVGFFMIATSLSFNACGNQENGNSDAGEDSVWLESEKGSMAGQLNISVSEWDSYVSKSLKSKGNNANLKAALAKIKNGEKVNIATIGGSVTEGAGPANFRDGYAYTFVDMIQESYPEADINYRNAGLSGTPSSLGALRYKKDVYDYFGKNPDILLIEFAVNDWQECSNVRGFEYMIRSALESDTAVIALYSAATYGNQQWAMTKTASHYKIPEVSISDALSGSKIDQAQGSVYYTDQVHPSAAGHYFMASCLLNLIRTVDSDEQDSKISISSYCDSNAFESLTTIYADSIPSEVTLTSGDFSAIDSSTQGLKIGGTEFPSNWHKNTAGDSSPLEVKISCKYLMLSYKVSSSTDFGSADIYVDGKSVKTLEGYSSSGWNNCETVSVIDETSVAEHTVSVKMSSTDSAKSFTILGIAFAN
ncbi:MAG: SGNH/GDSL hydrolase family protein [Treponema sp.]|nr:SGNH/GDSL hydrolase family protein [Treponema sp.]